MDLEMVPSTQELMARFAPYCRGLIRRYGSTPEIRQDLEGEVYCLVHDLAAGYDRSRGVPLSAYFFAHLRAGVYTYARAEWRRRAREVAVSRLPGTEWDPDSAVEDPASRIVQRLTILEAMVALTERQRAVVYLRYFQEQGFEEIAGLLRIRPATARSLLRHGLRHMRTMLRE